MRDDIEVRALRPSSPVRRVFAAMPRAAAVTPALATMLEILQRDGEKEPPPWDYRGRLSVVAICLSLYFCGG